MHYCSLIKSLNMAKSGGGGESRKNGFQITLYLNRMISFLPILALVLSLNAHHIRGRPTTQSQKTQPVPEELYDGITEPFFFDSQRHKDSNGKRVVVNVIVSTTRDGSSHEENGEEEGRGLIREQKFPESTHNEKEDLLPPLSLIYPKNNIKDKLDEAEAAVKKKKDVEDIFSAFYKAFSQNHKTAAQASNTVERFQLFYTNTGEGSYPSTFPVQEPLVPIPHPSTTTQLPQVNDELQIVSVSSSTTAVQSAEGLKPRERSQFVDKPIDSKIVKIKRVSSSSSESIASPPHPHPAFPEVPSPISEEITNSNNWESLYVTSTTSTTTTTPKPSPTPLRTIRRRRIKSRIRPKKEGKVIVSVSTSSSSTNNARKNENEGNNKLKSTTAVPSWIPQIWGEPEKVWGEPAKIWGEPAKVWGEPEKVWVKPEDLWGYPSSSTTTTTESTTTPHTRRPRYLTRRYKTSTLSPRTSTSTPLLLRDEDYPRDAEASESQQNNQQQVQDQPEDDGTQGTFVILGEDDPEEDSIDGSFDHHLGIPPLSPRPITLNQFKSFNFSYHNTFKNFNFSSLPSNSSTVTITPSSSLKNSNNASSNTNTSSTTTNNNSTRSGGRFGYVLEGDNVRRYRVEERTPDGYIVGEYGVLNNQNAFLRGVRYTADGTINPRLIHEALMKFLSLRRRRR